MAAAPAPALFPPTLCEEPINVNVSGAAQPIQTRVTLSIQLQHELCCQGVGTGCAG
jgi:hypothetical protein